MNCQTPRMSTFQPQECTSLVRFMLLTLFVQSISSNSNKKSQNNVNIFVSLLSGPGDIARSSTDKSDKLPASENLPNHPRLDLPNSMEQWQEEQERIDVDALETRKRPDYTVSYKQAVTTEDVFLQVCLLSSNIF